MCYEIRTEMPEAERMDYIMAEQRQKYRIAADSSNKLEVLESPADPSSGRSGLDHWHVPGATGENLRTLRITYHHGQDRVAEREALLEMFRTGEVESLVVSKVANFSIDLPDASVAIQISGDVGLPTGGSPAPGTHFAA